MAVVTRGRYKGLHVDIMQVMPRFVTIDFGTRVLPLTSIQMAEWEKLWWWDDILSTELFRFYDQEYFDKTGRFKRKPGRYNKVL